MIVTGGIHGALRIHERRTIARTVTAAMDSMMKGQTAIVTGGARGIGLGIVQRLAREGCRVVVWDRDVEGFDAEKAGVARADVAVGPAVPGRLLRRGIGEGRACGEQRDAYGKRTHSP